MHLGKEFVCCHSFTPIHEDKLTEQNKKIYGRVSVTVTLVHFCYEYFLLLILSAQVSEETDI